MWSPIRIRTSLPSNTNQIQVRVLTPCKVNIPYAFPCKPAHHSMNRPSRTARWATGSCRSSDPPAGLPMNRKPPGPNGSPVDRQFSAGSQVNRQVRPGYTSGRFTPRGISPTHRKKKITSNRSPQERGRTLF